MNTSTETPQIAVWYFVGATFLFAATTLFFPDSPMWVRIVLIAGGFVAIVAGGVQLGREIQGRRDRADENASGRSDLERDVPPPQAR